MQVAYKLNVDDLDINFVESIKKLFKEKQLYISISSVDEEDETAYLLSNQANASRLLNAINNIETHKEKLVYKTLEDLG
jgi:hypothetical protein